MTTRRTAPSIGYDNPAEPTLSSAISKLQPMQAARIRMFGTGSDGHIHPHPNEAALRAKKIKSGSKIAERVLGLLGLLSDETARKAIDGIANWISTWEQWIRDSPNFLDIWVRFWPIAVEATNAQQQDDVEPDLNLVARISGNHEPMDLDTLNTPAGKLVGAMLAAYPSVNQGERPFQTSYPLRLMRDMAIEAPGRAGLIARHRMTEGVPWFLIADPEWDTGRLLAPLSERTAESLALWRAIARRTHFGSAQNHW